MKAADEKLIADTTAHYGSREKASQAFVDAETFEPEKGYFYAIWAAAYYWRENYAAGLITNVPNQFKLGLSFVSIITPK